VKYILLEVTQELTDFGVKRSKFKVRMCVCLGCVCGKIHSPFYFY